MPYDDIIEKHARRVGVDPALMKKIMMIESSGRPREETGSYRGLFQLSDKEFRNHGGSGSIFDPEQNTMAAANKLAKESLDFKNRYGRDPKPIDIYMIHQQGEGGYAAHLSAPDAPAWKNMYMTAEGQQKGQGWAKDAIWGNLPKSVKQRVGSKDNIDQVTSRDFVSAWDDSMQGGGSIMGEGGGKIAGTPKAGALGGEVRDAKAAFVEGKNAKKPTLMGMDFEVPQPRINLQIPQFTPRIDLG